MTTKKRDRTAEQLELGVATRPAGRTNPMPSEVPLTYEQLKQRLEQACKVWGSPRRG